MKTTVEKKARAYAEKHGFFLRRIPHSLAHPNGYIQITSPTGVQFRADGMVDAVTEMIVYRAKNK